MSFPRTPPHRKMQSLGASAPDRGLPAAASPVPVAPRTPVAPSWQTCPSSSRVRQSLYFYSSGHEVTEAGQSVETERKKHIRSIIRSGCYLPQTEERQAIQCVLHYGDEALATERELGSPAEGGCLDGPPLSRLRRRRDRPQNLRRHCGRQGHRGECATPQTRGPASWTQGWTGSGVPRVCSKVLTISTSFCGWLMRLRSSETSGRQSKPRMRRYSPLNFARICCDFGLVLCNIHLRLSCPRLLPPPSCPPPSQLCAASI